MQLWDLQSWGWNWDLLLVVGPAVMGLDSQHAVVGLAVVGLDVGLAVVVVEVLGLNVGLAVGHTCSYGAGCGTCSCGTFGCGTCSPGAGRWTCIFGTCSWVVGLATVGVSGVVKFLDIFPIWKNFHLAFSP